MAKICINCLVVNSLEYIAEEDFKGYYSLKSNLSGHIESICPITGNIFRKIIFGCSESGALSENESLRKVIQSFLEKKYCRYECQIFDEEVECEIHNKITNYRIELSEPFISLFEDLFSPKKDDFSFVSGHLN